MNLNSYNNMKDMRCRIQCGKQISKLPYFCIEGQQRLVKYLHETDGSCLHDLCNSKIYYFIKTKLILGWILQRSSKKSHLSLTKHKGEQNFHFFFGGIFSNITLFKHIV